MVTGARWRKARRWLENVGEVLQQAVQEGGLGAARGVETPGGRDISARGADSLPQDALAVMPEGHAEVVEVP